MYQSTTRGLGFKAGGYNLAGLRRYSNDKLSYHVASFLRGLDLLITRPTERDPPYIGGRFKITIR